jgi:3'-5' exonuclease
MPVTVDLSMTTFLSMSPMPAPRGAQSKEIPVIVTLDIETVPSQDPAMLEAIRADLRENFKAPSTLTKEKACAELGMTDPDKIKYTSKDKALEMWVERFRDEKLEETAQEELHKTCFDGGKGHIAVIGLALDDAEPISGYCENSDGAFDISLEREVISLAFDRISDAYNSSCDMRPVFVGHNIAGFDLRFLFQRAVVLGIKPPSIIPFHARPWDPHIFDTMISWAGVGNRISLDNLCKALHIEGKGGMDGSQVWGAIQQGRIKEVDEYCRHDVSITRAAYYRLSFAQAA